MVRRGGLTLPLVSSGVLLLVAGCTVGPFGRRAPIAVTYRWSDSKYILVRVPTATRGQGTNVSIELYSELPV